MSADNLDLSRVQHSVWDTGRRYGETRNPDSPRFSLPPPTQTTKERTRTPKVATQPLRRSPRPTYPPYRKIYDTKDTYTQHDYGRTLPDNRKT